MNASPQWIRALRAADLFAVLRATAPQLGSLARADDVTETFPSAAMQLLAQAGCLHAVLPKARGGLCLGWHESSRTVLLDLLRAVGGVHLSAARLFEGHVNAFQLLWLHGDPAQREALCHYVGEGGLLGVWNAPSPHGDMLLEDREPGNFTLRGAKAYASGAGHIRRPLVTARHEQLGLLMLWPALPYTVGPATEWQMQGMRASLTRSVKFEGPVEATQIFGGTDDYHRQPLFSGGAWRFLAAQLGAAEALCEEMRRALLARQRQEDPHQRQRMAHCHVALASAWQWIDRASCAAFDDTLDAADVVQQVDAARIAVEELLLGVLEHVQRSVGLSGFSRRCEIERVGRDLATYLRQPAPDALREAVGARRFEQAVPGLNGGLYAIEC